MKKGGLALMVAGYAAAAGMVFVVNLISTATHPVFGRMSDGHARPWLIPLAMLAIGIGISFIGILPIFRVGR